MVRLRLETKAWAEGERCCVLGGSCPEDQTGLRGHLRMSKELSLNDNSAENLYCLQISDNVVDMYWPG